MDSRPHQYKCERNFTELVQVAIFEIGGIIHFVSFRLCCLYGRLVIAGRR